MSQIVNIEIPEKGLALPVDKKVLGEFISGLLGQSQSLERTIETAFSVDHQWLVHLCTLLLQRIEQQNAPEPLAFEAVISYQNGLRRKISSLPAFEHFAETQNIVSIGIQIKITILIQFPSKQAPEKQELVLGFLARESKLGVVEAMIGRDPKLGLIEIELLHTERTWADDIVRLIEDEIRSIQTEENRLKRWTRKTVFPVFSFLLPLSMVVGTGFTEWAKQRKDFSLTQQINAAIVHPSTKLSDLDAKIDLLLTQSLSNSDYRMGASISVVIALMAAGFIWISAYMLAKPSPSFVVISQAAARHKAETLERLKKRNLVLIGSMIVSLVLGVAGNYIYDYLKR